MISAVLLPEMNKSNTKKTPRGVGASSPHQQTPRKNKESVKNLGKCLFES